jgi:acyl-CoA thioester hydrolase
MDLLSLAITHQATVLETYLDKMGHMNVMWYTHLFDRATWRFFANTGMDLAYYEREKAGAFALEQHTRYLAELRQGQAVTLRTRALDRTAKRFHFLHFMIRDEDGILAATSEIVGIHVDALTRRSSPLPQAIATALDKMIADHQRLGWEPPTCGVMGP